MKLMKKIPGGTLLVPMMISAIIHTFFPNLFNIGGVTEALWTKKFKLYFGSYDFYFWLYCEIK